MEWVWLCVAPPIQEMGLRGRCCTVAFLNVCAVWTCGFCVYKYDGKATPVLCRPIVLYGVCLPYSVGIYTVTNTAVLCRPLVPYSVVVQYHMVSAYIPACSAVLCCPMVPDCVGL